MDDPSVRRPSEFRLIDLMVGICAIVIVVALLLPARQKIHDDGSRVICRNNLKSIALAIHDYANAFSNQLPPLSGAPISNGIAHPQSIFVTLLPFLEQDGLYKDSMKGPRGETWNGMDQRTGSPIFSTSFVRTFSCPGDVSNSTTLPMECGWAGCSYAVNAQIFGNKPRTVTAPTGTSWNELASDFTIDTIPDGIGNTIFVAERFAQAGGPGGTSCAWANPPAGGAGLGNKERDALGCALQNFVSNHGIVRASICGPGTFYGSGTQADPVGARGGAWKYPLPDIDLIPTTASRDGRPQSEHTGLVLIAMADGSVRGISKAVGQLTWARAICPDDGQPLGSDW
jgi:hypothetical protein